MFPVTPFPGKGDGIPVESAVGVEALLAAWESAEPQHPIDRALTILRAAYPDRTRDELARLSIGERDALLFGFHAANFGPRLAAQAFCPQCAGHVELDLDLRDLAINGGRASTEGTFEVELDDLALVCRAPDSYDLAAVATSVDLAAGRRMLLDRCIMQMTRRGAAVELADLGEEQVAGAGDAVASAMEGVQPLANLELLIACPTCGHGWTLLLDIVDFVWTRIERQTRRLLSEVDALAQAYGWREADILALSPARRQIYLEMVRG